MKIWNDLSVKVKVITSVISILVAFLAVHPYLPSSLSLAQLELTFNSAMASETTDREQADLETQLDIVELEIDFLLRQKTQQGLSQYDQDKLDMAIKRRDRLISRLNNILA